jgi:hypothetical protein
MRIPPILKVDFELYSSNKKKIYALKPTFEAI